MEHDKLDNKLKQKFESFEVNPPEMVWEKVKKNLDQTNSGATSSKKGNFLKPGIIPVLAVLLVGALSIFLLKNNKQAPKQGLTSSTEEVNNDIIVESIPVQPQKTLVVEEISQTHTPEKLSISIPDEPIINNNTIQKDSPVAQENISEPDLFKEETLIEKPTIEINKVEPGKSIVSKNISLDNQNDYIHSNMNYDDNIPGDSYSLTSMHSSLKDSILSLYQQELEFDSGNHWYLGFAYTIDQTNKQEMISDKFMSYSAEGTVAYSRKNFIIQTGLEVVRSMDRFDYSINHRTTDTLGSYQHVIGLDFDTTGSIPTPIYTTETAYAIDTLHHELQTEKELQYTYLQIPLTFGYQFSGRRNLSYAIRTGPIYSILIKDQNRTLIDEENYDITGYKDHSLSRLKTSWQYLIAVDINYQLNDKMNLYLEPRFKYYYNGVYNVQQIQKGKPYSIGLRFGIFYRL